MKAVEKDGGRHCGLVGTPTTTVASLRAKMPSHMLSVKGQETSQERAGEDRTRRGRAHSPNARFHPGGQGVAVGGADRKSQKGRRPGAHGTRQAMSPQRMAGCLAMPGRADPSPWRPEGRCWEQPEALTQYRP